MGQSSVNNGLVLNLDLRKNQGCKMPDKTGINYCVFSGTGKAFDINGYVFTSAGSDYIDCGNNSNVNSTDQLTISAWIYMNSTATGVSKQTSGASGFSYYVAYNSDNKVYFQMTGNGTTVAYGQSQITYLTNQWAYVTCVYNGNEASNATRCKIYINGVQITCNFSGTIPASLYQTTAPLTINKYNGSTYGNGKIGQVKIWKRALLPTEIRSEYQLIKR